ncbi:MAG: tetratricopeptide repeat protein [candidate division WOR-3 bacterium]|nr:MAG: tetratricopeptide repeat protein [candidate division WOR-3 bacterium]
MAIIGLFRILTLALFLYSGDGAYELFSIGNQLEMEGRLEEAMEYYERAHELEPASAEIIVSLASVLYQVQRFDEGIAYLHTALEIEPENLRLYQMLALGYVGKRQLNEAIKYYKMALKLAPENEDIYLAISTLFEANRNLSEAISSLENMPENMKTADILLRLANLSSRMNDHPSAVDYYRKAYSLDTTDLNTTIGLGTGFDMLGVNDSALYYYEKANADTFISNVAQRLIDLYTEVDRYDKVITVANEILILEPGNTHVRRSLGFAYYKVEMFIKALNEFSIVLRYDPSDTYSAFYLARIYMEQGDYDRSRIEIESALDVNPDFIELWVYLGFVAIEEEDYDLAEYAFTEAGYRGGDLAQIYYLLGAVMETRENNPKAYYYYNKAIEKNPTNVAALQSLASITSSVGRENETFNTFQKILQIDTLNAVALNYIGYTYAERNDSLEYALRLIDRALEIDADNGYYTDSRGWVLYKMGRLEEALHELKRASEIVEDAVILEHLGDVYRELGESNAALDAYKRALEIEPGNKALRSKIDKVE